MKKLIWILIVPALLMSGCLEEGTDNCAADMSFVFQHQESTGGFDSEIGNDVYLHIYRDDILHSAIRVPYSEIEGGREFRMRKDFTGQLSVAAWAVNPNGDVSLIPSEQVNGKYSDSELGHREITRAGVHCLPLCDVYLGKVDVHSVKEAENVYLVDMANATCRVTVNVHTGVFFDAADGDPQVRISGPATKCTLDMAPCGDDAIVFTGLNATTEATFTTNRFNILSTPEGRTLSVTGMSGDDEVFLVETDEVSSPGDEIIIDIYGAEAEVTVNGWRTKYTVQQL